MKTFLSISLLLGAFAFFVAGCDEGLNPRDVFVPTGTFAGLISYEHWPPRDSIVDLRLVAFRTYPPRNIVTEVLEGSAVVYPPLSDTSLVPLFVDSLRYAVNCPVGDYRYVVVAQQYGPNVMQDWQAVGQYDLDSLSVLPSPIRVAANDTLRGINIHVDFQNPPPQP